MALQPKQEAQITKWFQRLQTDKSKPKDPNVHTKATQKDPQSSCDTVINLVDEDAFSTPPAKVPQARARLGARRALDFSSPPKETKMDIGVPEHKSAVFDSQGDVIHHQPAMPFDCDMQHEPELDRAVHYVLGGVCPFCKLPFLPDVPRTEERLLKVWDHGYEFKEHLRECEHADRYERYVHHEGWGPSWCVNCEVLSLQKWHAASPENLAMKFPLGSKWPMSFFFFECDGLCSSFSMSTLEKLQDVQFFDTSSMLKYFCFECRAFTKQGRLIRTAGHGEPYLPFFGGMEPLQDCAAGCPKHAELKQITEQKAGEWGKYWCSKCQLYSKDYFAQDTHEIKVTPLWLGSCTCNEASYWCTDCKRHSIQRWEKVGRSFFELFDAPPAHFKLCPADCKRQKAEDEALCTCDRCKVATATQYRREKRGECPYKDWPDCKCASPPPPLMEREDSAHEWIVQPSRTTAVI